MDGYWARFTEQRATRRRALVLTGATAAGAAFLAACGGGESGNGDGKGSSGIVTQPVDTLKSAKRGGVMKDRIHGDVATFDPFTANNTLNAIEGMTNSSLVLFKPGYLKPSENELGPDL